MAGRDQHGPVGGDQPFPRDVVERPRAIGFSRRVAEVALLVAAGLLLREIAELQGVSIGTVYQYFASKQDILAALAQRRAGAVRDAIAETIIRKPDVSSVRSIVQALMHGFEGSPTTRQALLDAMFLRGGDSVLARHHEAFLAAIAGRARLQLELTSESAFVLTHTAVSLLRAAAACTAFSCCSVRMPVATSPFRQLLRPINPRECRARRSLSMRGL